MVVPAGNVDRGKKLFTQRCAVCHNISSDGKNKVGPNLYGVMGRRTGGAKGYVFSDGMKNKGVIWTDDNLFEFLENPRKYIPGTKMLFAGLKKVDERADVITYMKQASKA